MKKVLTLLSLLTICFASAQSKKTLLWKISGKGLEKPSYLFGTIHLSCNAIVDEKVKNAMGETSALYLEIDMDDPSLQSELAAGMTMKNGQQISSMLNAEEKSVLDTFVRTNFGISLSLVDTFKPHFLSAMYMPSLLDCTVQSLETTLMEIATLQNKEVLGLETVQEQMAVFDAIPYEAQLADLMASVKGNFERERSELKSLYEIYNQQDLLAMLELMKSSETAMADKYAHLLLDNRNKSWISQIEQISKQRAVFYAVGAAHLPGDNGVIRLLQKKGYTLTPM